MYPGLPINTLRVQEPHTKADLVGGREQLLGWQGLVQSCQKLGAALAGHNVTAIGVVVGSCHRARISACPHKEAL